LDFRQPHIKNHIHNLLLGVTDSISAGLISQALSSCIAVKDAPTEDWDLICALLRSLEPRNAQESMLAIQMLGMHYQTILLLSRANKSDHLDLKEGVCDGRTGVETQPCRCDEMLPQ
jgi:hypothetical protein